jgi:hypothetical protein
VEAEPWEREVEGAGWGWGDLVHGGLGGVSNCFPFSIFNSGFKLESISNKIYMTQKSKAQNNTE